MHSGSWILAESCMHVACACQGLHGACLLSCIGFGCWVDEDFIGRDSWLHACKLMNTCMSQCFASTLIGSWMSCMQCWIIWRKVCRVTRRCHCFGIAVRTTSRCLSHYRRLWAKKKWLKKNVRWKKMSDAVLWGGQAWWCDRFERFFLVDFNSSRKPKVEQK